MPIVRRKQQISLIIQTPFAEESVTTPDGRGSEIVAEPRASASGILREFMQVGTNFAVLQSGAGFSLRAGFNRRCCWQERSPARARAHPMTVPRR
jgi:hypothetical protein